MKGFWKGLFVAFEGIDYAGKWTQLHRTRCWLENQLGLFVCWASEPNDQWGLMGRHIRLILKGELPAPPSLEFQRLYVIDRAEDVVCFIRPSLERGNIVLRERYALSTLAYGMLDGDVEPYLKLHRDILGPFMLLPDLTILLDVSAEEALARMTKVKAVPQFFEKKEKLERVRQNYLVLAKRNDLGEIAVLNGARSEGEVFAEIQELLKKRLDLT